MPKGRTLLTDEEVLEKARAVRAEKGDVSAATIRKTIGVSENRIKRVLGEDAPPAGIEQGSGDYWKRVEMGGDILLTLFGAPFERCKGHDDNTPTCSEIYAECKSPAKAELMDVARKDAKLAKRLHDMSMPGGIGAVVWAMNPVIRSAMFHHVVPGLRRRQQAEPWEQPEEIPVQDNPNGFTPGVVPQDGADAPTQ